VTLYQGFAEVSCDTILVMMLSACLHSESNYPQCQQNSKMILKFRRGKFKLENTHFGIHFTFVDTLLQDSQAPGKIVHGQIC
jgi:hypothetical protein